MTLRNRRAGFALPMVIMVIGFMTAGVLAAFARSGSEVQIIDNQRAQLQAFAMAEAGLQRFMATGRLPQTSADTTLTITVSGGTVTITGARMRPPAQPTDTVLWIVRARSSVAGGAVTRPRGARTVAQLVRRTTGTMQVVSSWSSLSGLDKAGSSGVISGKNACGADTLAGVALPTGTYSQSGTGDPIIGKPPVQEMGTPAQMAAEIKIDWVGITTAADPAITPDYIRCVSGSYGYDASWAPCTGWPSSTQWDNMYNNNIWPTIVINGTSALPSNGRGTLIVTGDLTFGGGDTWDGIIMVGGKIVDNGSGNIAGAVVSGLNLKRPDPWPSTVGKSSKANGTKDYTYDSCKVASAAAGQSKMLPISDAWVDNWATW